MAAPWLGFKLPINVNQYIRNERVVESGSHRENSLTWLLILSDPRGAGNDFSETKLADLADLYDLNEAKNGTQIEGKAIAFVVTQESGLSPIPLHS